MEQNKVGIFGVPVDLGASRRGTDMGPSALRYAKLHETLHKIGYEVIDHGNLHVPIPEGRSVGNPKMKFAKEIIDICEQLADQVSDIVTERQIPLILGGDHSLTMGSIAGIAPHYKQVGLLWIDAHCDFNTPATTPSGNVHGMSLAASTGCGDDSLKMIKGFSPKVLPEHAVIVGARQIDHLEKETLFQCGVHVFTMREIDEQGIANVMRQAIDLASAGGNQLLYLSFDLDVVDPMFAPGVGTPVPGGLTYREAHLAMELLYDSKLLCGLEMMEVNPIIDKHNDTAKLGVSLAASALGQRIL